MPGHRRAGWIVAMAFAVSLGAACGDDDETSGATSTTADDTSATATTDDALSATATSGDTSSATATTNRHAPSRPMVTIVAEPGTSDASDTGASGQGDVTLDPQAPPICAPLFSIAGLSGEIADAISSSDDWEVVRKDIVDIMSPRLDDYEEVGSLLLDDPDLAANVDTLRRFTAGIIETAGTSASAQAFFETLQAFPELAAINAATSNVDTYTRSTCGFALTPPTGGRRPATPTASTTD